MDPRPIMEADRWKEECKAETGLGQIHKQAGRRKSQICKIGLTHEEKLSEGAIKNGSNKKGMKYKWQPTEWRQNPLPHRQWVWHNSNKNRKLLITQEDQNKRWMEYFRETHNQIKPTTLYYFEADVGKEEL